MKEKEGEREEGREGKRERGREGEREREYDLNPTSWAVSVA